MKKMLDYIHDPFEMALYTACALGIVLNASDESYGGTESIRCIKGGDVVFHSKATDVVAYLCSLHKKINAILALLSAEGIDHQDCTKAIKSLNDTVGAKQNVELYKYWIHGNSTLIMQLNSPESGCAAEA